MAKLIKVQKDKRVLHVTEKSFEVVYSNFGYRKIGEVEEQQPVENDVDLFELTEEELNKVNKDVIQAFLKKEEIEFDSGAKKEELIKIVLGKE